MKPVDFSYLEGLLAGDAAVIGEVLDIFRQQAGGWTQGLDEGNPEWRRVAHTVKGAARGIGANPLGELCHAVELGEAAKLPAARAELAAAVAAIEAYRAGGD
jgi:hypothetical protein